MLVEVSLLISGISALCALIFGLASTKRGQAEETRNEVGQLTTVLVKLDNIGSGVKEIKDELSNLRGTVEENRERIIRVEESTKQAHKRLDALGGTYEKR